MLLGGNKRVEIDLREQPRTFRSVFGKGFRNQENNLVLRLDIDMHSFIPNKPNSDTLYWGYLIRIIDFEVQLDDQLLEYNKVQSPRSLGRPASHLMLRV